MRKLWDSLVDKSIHSLLLVLERECRMEKLSFVLHTRGQRGIE